jgi:SIR2-like domain
MKRKPAVQWQSNSSEYAMWLLKEARAKSRPVIWLLGAGLSVDAGIPLAAQLSQYLVHFATLVRKRGFVSARHYLEESRWPSRHDLRVDLMLELAEPSLTRPMKPQERFAAQDAMVSELRRASPTLAFSFDEIFGQLRDERWNKDELASEFRELESIATHLAKRVPRNVAYRSLLFHLCDGSQALIDGCLDHFIRDRSPTTTHQLIAFATQLFRSRVILSTNFDSLLEQAFASENIQSRAYEIQGEGTLPSAKLLLSQQFSIVKLHGGAHQMRTGFNLDDPLSPAVLGSFYELFDGLQQSSGQNPLMIVLGYSGADRRVMDIVATHIKRWRRGESPCVLWINRDPWVPIYLESTVATHPHILQQQIHLGKPDDPNVAPKDSVANKFPVHLLKYKEGRLFLLEAYQHLMGSFPIGRSPYQVVNFVPHSTVREVNTRFLQNEIESKQDWHIMLIAAEQGGGSSSQLAELAEHLDLHYRVIWIDLAEVTTLSALLDVLAERLGKFDDRLSKLRRPLLMSRLLEHCAINELHPDAKRLIEDTDKREMTVAIRWLQHALRRGQYLLALDSMDEFGSTHPASGVGIGQVQHERRLLCEFVRCLLEEPGSLGDSRIAIATQLLSVTPGAVIPPELEGSSELELQELFRRKAGDDKARVHFIPLPGQSSLPVVESDRKSLIFNSWKGLAIDNNSIKAADAELAPIVDAAVANKTDSQQLDWNSIARLIVATASACRRIRSEVLLLATCNAVGGDSIPTGELTDKKFEEKIGEFLFSDPHICPLRSGTEEFWTASSAAPLPTMLRIILRLANAEEKKRERPDAKTWFGIAGEVYKKAGTLQQSDFPPLWFYRVEGGYHWMHRVIRDDLYAALRKDHPLLMSRIHQVVGNICRDGLYDRSKDARAFLEYLFHHTSSIKIILDLMSAKKDKFKSSQRNAIANWLSDIARTVRREKGHLLTRVRLPSLIQQMIELQKAAELSVEVLGSPLEGDASHESQEARRRREQCSASLNQILRVYADLLLAAGHPHAAVPCHFERLRLIASCSSNPPTGVLSWPGTLKIGESGIADEMIQFLTRLVSTSSFMNFDPGLSKSELLWLDEWKLDSRVRRPFAEAVSDLANAIQDPFLFEVFHSAGPQVSDWSDGRRWPDRASSLVLARRLFALASYCNDEEHSASESCWSDGIAIASDLSSTILKRWAEGLLIHKASYISDGPYPSVGVAYGTTIAGEQKTGDSAASGLSVTASSAYSWLKLNVTKQRKTVKSLRHECYRLCMLARLLGVDSLHDQATWTRIEQYLAEAQAVLNRQGEPADLQALATTRLIYADLSIRRSESLTNEVRKLIEMTEQDFISDFAVLLSDKNSRLHQGKNPSMIQRAVTSCERATQYLESIDRLFAEGRGENRWRWFLGVVRCRVQLYKAICEGRGAPVKAMESLYWSLRYLQDARINCGRRTDRRILLDRLWETIRSLATGGYFVEAGNSQWSLMLSRVGEDWNLNWEQMK